MEQVRPATVRAAPWSSPTWTRRSGAGRPAESVEDDSVAAAARRRGYLTRTWRRRARPSAGAARPRCAARCATVGRMVTDPAERGGVYETGGSAPGSRDSAEVEMGTPAAGGLRGLLQPPGDPHRRLGLAARRRLPFAVDSYAWMSRFGDPGFRRHAAAASVAAALLLRLANAEVLPYDYAEFARTMRGYLPAGVGAEGEGVGRQAPARCAPRSTRWSGRRAPSPPRATRRWRRGGRGARARAANQALLRVGSGAHPSVGAARPARGTAT